MVIRQVYIVVESIERNPRIKTRKRPTCSSRLRSDRGQRVSSENVIAVDTMLGEIFILQNSVTCLPQKIEEQLSNGLLTSDMFHARPARCGLARFVLLQHNLIIFLPYDDVCD